MIRIWPPFEFHLNSTPAQGTRGVRGIFFRGGKVIFPWQKILILVHPKQILVVLFSLLFFSTSFIFPCLSFPGRSAEISQWEVSGHSVPLPPVLHHCWVRCYPLKIANAKQNHLEVLYVFCLFVCLFVCLFLFVCLYVVLKDIVHLMAHNWQKWKRVFLTCPCHKFYRDEAVSLKSCKYLWKIMIFVKMWKLGQYRENYLFCQ